MCPDYKYGAMENVGVITFRDWLLLVDEKTAPARQKRAYAYVMAHELAHEWFAIFLDGQNLVENCVKS